MHQHLDEQEHQGCAHPGRGCKEARREGVPGELFTSSFFWGGGVKAKY